MTTELKHIPNRGPVAPLPVADDLEGHVRWLQLWLGVLAGSSSVAILINTLTGVVPA